MARTHLFSQTPDPYALTVSDWQSPSDATLSDPSAIPNSQTTANSLVYQSNGLIAGQTIGQWTEAWWTWALQTPAATAPMTDPTGAFAGVDNDRAVFFIAGSFGGDATRTFDAPAGKPLLLPVLNDVVLQFSGRGPDPATGGKGAANIALADWLKSVTSVFLTIDGEPVTNLQSDRVRSTWFSPGTAQPGSLIESFGFSGDLGPARSDGYWAMLRPLAAGRHEIDFGGTASVSVHIHDTIFVS